MRLTSIGAQELLFFFLAILSALHANPQAPALIENDQTDVNLAPYMSSLADLKSQVSIEDLFEPGVAQTFEPITTRYPNFGIIEGSYWLRFTLRNTMSTDAERYIDIERTTLDRVELYGIHDGEVESHQVVGSDTLYRDRPVPARQPVFLVRLEPESERTYFLRITTVGATGTEVTLLHPSIYHQRESNRIAAMGLYFGMLAIMVAHYVMMYWIFRELSFLYLAATVFLMIAYVATYKGYTFQFVIPESPNVSQRFTLPLAGVLFSFGALFTERFLNARENSPRMAQMLFAVAALGFCVPIINAIDALWTDRVSYFLGILGPIVILGTAISCLRAAKRPVWIFLGAWSLLLVSAAAYALSGIGFFPDSFIAENGPLLAFPIMLLMLSLATWDRFKLLEEQHRDELEQRVEDRTHELAEALENVRTLEGFIPICSHCKKVRDDAGFWNQIESYIVRRSDAEFSHSICPDCMDTHYPDLPPKVEPSSPAG